MKWYQNYGQIVAFGTVLKQAGALESADDVLNYMENIRAKDDALYQTWDPLYTIWTNLGSPTEGEDGWEDFVNSFEEEEAGAVTVD